MPIAYLNGHDDASRDLLAGLSYNLVHRALTHFSLKRTDYWRGYVDGILGSMESL